MVPNMWPSSGHVKENYSVKTFLPEKNINSVFVVSVRCSLVLIRSRYWLVGAVWTTTLVLTLTHNTHTRTHTYTWSTHRHREKTRRCCNTKTTVDFQKRTTKARQCSVERRLAGQAHISTLIKQQREGKQTETCVDSLPVHTRLSGNQ